MLRRIGIIAVLSLIVTALATVPALAEIVEDPQQSGVDASGNLTVSFTEEIPDPFIATAQIPLSYRLTGHAEATYVCLKKNGRPPRGGPVAAGTVEGTVTAQDVFFAEPDLDETGTPVASAVSGSLTVSPPPPTGLSCEANNLRLFLASVTYGVNNGVVEGLLLHNETFGTDVFVGPYTRTLI